MLKEKHHFILLLNTITCGTLASYMNACIYFLNTLHVKMYSILKTLQERIVERDSLPCAEQNTEKNAWEHFWKKHGPDLLHHACSHGSVQIVKLLVNMSRSLRFKSCMTPIRLSAMIIDSSSVAHSCWPFINVYLQS